MQTVKPGLLVFLGSGETSTSGGKVFDWLARQLSPPLKIGLLETPAGFELNSTQVIGRVGDFLKARLQNYHPQVWIIPARKRGGRLSPENLEILSPLRFTNLVFMGPGSPTYAVRQLAGSLAWRLLQARHRMGVALAFSSAGVLAVSRQALPVYEIYKAGEDPFWSPGLDLLGDFGLEIIFIPHWNNRDGGADLDTSRSFIGQERFSFLQKQLPESCNVVGIDEQTALAMDLATGKCRVMGKDSVHILHNGKEMHYPHRSTFPLDAFGGYRIPDLTEGIPEKIFDFLQTSERSSGKVVKEPPKTILRLAQQREEARQSGNWKTADELREEIQRRGWQVLDTPEGLRLERLPGQGPEQERK